MRYSVNIPGPAHQSGQVQMQKEQPDPSLHYKHGPDKEESQPGIPPLHPVREQSSLYSRIGSKVCTTPSNILMQHVQVHPQQEAPEKLVHKPSVKWPKANDRNAWMSFKASLLTILQSLLRGSVASKMAMFSRIVYEEGILRFRTKPKREIGSKQCGRRESEILQLVKEQSPGTKEGWAEKPMGPDQVQTGSS